MRSVLERRAALEASYPQWHPSTLDAFLSRQARQFGERPFVITDDRTWTYAQVDDQARLYGDGLASMGVRSGDRVGLLMANYPEFVPLKFAIARCGAVAIPFNFLYREEELDYVLRQSECSVLITMTGFAGLDYPAMLARIGSLPRLHTVIALSTDGRTVPNLTMLPDLERLGRDHPGSADAGLATPQALGDILYTSGTTGLPKGVMVSHDAVLRTGYASALTRGFEDGRRILFSLPCYHMFGYVEGLLASMYVGGAVIPRTSFSPADYLASIARHGATEMLCVPTMMVALLDHPARRTTDLSSLVACLAGSAPAPVWMWERMQSELGIREITTGYGMTECGGAMTMTLPDDPLELHASTIGRPKLAGSAGLRGRDRPELIAYRTVEPLTGDPLPPGAVGELVSCGPTQMLGYWEKPMESEAALAGGWVHSGDLGRVRDDGYLELTGRSKELYKSGGELVMPKEIEELLTRHPGVSQAYAVGVPDDRWGEAGCVWIVPTEPDRQHLDAGELMALCREKLARFKVPKAILFIDAADLPMTPTGKVQKFRLVTLAQERLGHPSATADSSAAATVI